MVADGAVALVLRRLGGHDAVLVLADRRVRLGDRPDCAALADRLGALPVRMAVEVPGTTAGQLERDLAGPVTQVDRRFGAGDLMVVLEGLNRHQRNGSDNLDKPLALMWAIGQVAAGRDRLFPWPLLRAEVRSLLADFGGTGTSPVPQDLYRSLTADPELWETADPATGSTAADDSARIGFTEQSAELLTDPAVRAQAVDVLRATYLVEVDQPELLRRVGLPVPVAPSAVEVLQGLVGREIKTVTGYANRVLTVGPVNAIVRTARSAEGRPVPVAEVQAGLDRLFARGRVAATTSELGYRSAFVAAVLGTLPRAVVSRNPAVVSLGYAPTGVDEQFGEMDRVAVAKYRVEQQALRHVLLGDEPEGRCALCGRVFPVELLVAAHVKRRSECSDDERRDLRNVAMPACWLGCDRLYELGYVTVGADGRVLTATATGALDEQLAKLAGAVSPAHRPASAAYFAWHRENVFRDRSVAGPQGDPGSAC
ncbi:hypothetical protein [Saccharothrix algeriensis]|uniref:ScoMcrA-like DNA sulfur-binding domain-containing protein n=1 Tax=Saccharothrix algeriensis TaxID=173560 RepID=A0ABS2SBV1_9PSEU|nr:hypothetical protein [Saccharothrix algeriensis]MBM7813718.1 hypothetical protein [Saccharothrix algeriensis]